MKVPVNSAVRDLALATDAGHLASSLRPTSVRTDRPDGFDHFNLHFRNDIFQRRARPVIQALPVNQMEPGTASHRSRMTP